MHKLTHKSSKSEYHLFAQQRLWSELLTGIVATGDCFGFCVYVRWLFCTVCSLHLFA
eukprot:m.390173 g.390173  ORF g.390173 m.390173 type:complete len:57 (+) comp191583_c0_seq1:34-204(+)